MTEITSALVAGACLLDSSGQSSARDLRAVLVKRLTRYYVHLGLEPPSLDTQSLEETQLRIAKEAITVLARIQHIIQEHEPSESGQPSSAPPLMGTKDLGQIRTLLSVAFGWGVKYLLARIVVVLQARKGPRFSATAEDFHTLKDIFSDVLRLVFPQGTKERVAQTYITTTIMDNHAADTLKSCFVLGWLPKSLTSDGIQPLDTARPATDRILNLLTPSQGVIVLGSILSQATLAYVRKVCASFLSRQLLRPHGVRGLCLAVFGLDEASNEDAPIEKLEHFARVLTTVPATMSHEEYFRVIIPPLICMLSPRGSSTEKRAASYTLSRILSTDNSFPHQDTATQMTFAVLHAPFLTFVEGKNSSTDDFPCLQDPAVILPMLITLVSNADPSPTLLSTLLSPIVPSLYSLLYRADKVRTVDPTLKESLRAMLVSWAKIVDPLRSIEVLWSLLANEEGSWEIDLDGFRRTRRSMNVPSLSLFTPKDLRAMEENCDVNILNLYPDPQHFVGFLSEATQPEVIVELFSKLLEAFRNEKSKAAEGDPLRTLLYLQIIMQMQTLMTQGRLDMLSKPARLLAFIRHLLDPIHYRHNKEQDVHSHFSDTFEDPDSDDDMPRATVNAPDRDMTETALTLLLSVLEANEGLSARTEPQLNDLFDLLEPLARNGSPTVSSLAREARITMTARLASTSQGTSYTEGSKEESAQVIYQKALKLLQDSLLPVRAHGLFLLRQIVAVSGKGSNGKGIDSALIPAILSIFLQFIQDDDSYLFLNAVKGLASMVDAFGKDVMKGLIKEYSEGLQGVAAANLSQRDLDKRIRIGEALASSIQRCGEALVIYTDILLPPFFLILRSQDVPTALRMSTISLLTECEKASSLAMLPYINDLFSTMIDVLQVESVPAKKPDTVSGDPARKVPILDEVPTSTDPKSPAFRRAAVHFLIHVIRRRVQHVEVLTSVLPGLLKRAKIALSYVASVDEDNILRRMAGEACEELEYLSQAIMGI